MPCLYCNANFTLFKWKKRCEFCTQLFCTTCIVRKRCLACSSILNCQWKYDSLMNVKIKDLKMYLSVRGTPVHLYTEKNELVRLVILRRNQSDTRAGGTNSDHQSSTSLGRSGSFFMEAGRQDIGDLRRQAFTTGTASENTSLPSQSGIITPPDFTADMGTSNTLIANQSDAIPRDVEDSNVSPEGVTVVAVERPKPTGLANKIVIADIESTDQIDLLTARELKQILVDNFIDYKGCVEKIELQIRVRSLYHDKKKSNQESDDSNTCKICWDEPIDCVLLDCGHMATCTSCGKRLNECPICRQFIVRCVHVFKS